MRNIPSFISSQSDLNNSLRFWLFGVYYASNFHKSCTFLAICIWSTWVIFSAELCYLFLQIQLSLRPFWDASPDLLGEGINTAFSTSCYLSDFEKLSLLGTEPLSHVQISKEIGKLVLVCVGNLFTTSAHKMQFKTQGQATPLMINTTQRMRYSPCTIFCLLPQLMFLPLQRWGFLSLLLKPMFLQASNPLLHLHMRCNSKPKVKFQFGRFS